jgi:DHA1 family bicyclomycin/chloramphenicol resistance-like MFS transporter
MTPNQNQSSPSYLEFVILVSMMMSLMALSIDAMLPALPQIGSDLNVPNANDRQLVVSTIFLGVAVGQLFFGPLSDKTGRKPAMYMGYSLYICGSLLSAFANTFPMMLFGRMLQGIGISEPRAVLLALVRDLYKGRLMAQVMSFVSTVLLLIPMVAPTLGQAILLHAGWRSIFFSFVLMALITLIWFALRMPETLSPENHKPFSLKRIVDTTIEIIKIRPAFGYTISIGLISGAFLGYLNSAQQLFQEHYALGEKFPLYFALIALSIGLATFLNARLVIRLGMRFLVRRSLIVIFGLSTLHLGIAIMTSGHLPLWLVMAYLMTTFFCVGILFGNQNALAMEPLGHLAGIGAAIVGSLSTLISIPLGTLIGRSYNGTAIPMIIGITVLSGLSLSVVHWAKADSKVDNEDNDVSYSTE